MRTRQSTKITIALCALLSMLALVAGCGDDGGGNSGVSGRDKLDALQARADIAEYCSVQAGGTGALTDRSLGIMLDAVRDLARVYREHANSEIEIPVERKTLTTQQLMREEIRELRDCGRFGRQQAGVLEAVLQQRAQS
jgi:hypothetical protein